MGISLSSSLPLHGQYGYPTPQYGLVIDHLLAATAITSSATELEASADENPDLSWAFQGAGRTVGVMTEVVFKVCLQGNQV